MPTSAPSRRPPRTKPAHPLASSLAKRLDVPRLKFETKQDWYLKLIYAAVVLPNNEYDNLDIHTRRWIDDCVKIINAADGSSVFLPDPIDIEKALNQKRAYLQRRSLFRAKRTAMKAAVAESIRYALRRNKQLKNTATEMMYTVLFREGLGYPVKAALREVHGEGYSMNPSTARLVAERFRSACLFLDSIGALKPEAIETLFKNVARETMEPVNGKEADKKECADAVAEEQPGRDGTGEQSWSELLARHIRQ